MNVELECVKSNFGTSEFKPINGRWVLGLTFYYHRLGQSSRICVRLFRSRWDSIAPSLREHSCITLDRLSINKYWGTGSKII